MSDGDYLLALELQKEFERELNSPRDFDVKPVEERLYQKRRRSDDEDLNRTQNLVHPQWETLDPTPDVNALFRAFDDKFFQGRLRCVVLEWSKRMYSCAGICYTRRNRLGMAVTIRLSEPLLKLRTRKDLIETLLHEMIHAYCSVLGIREGNGGHGPNFKKIMNGINKVAGTNITVYHNFHDEVDVYKTHWWRCNGICQNRKPFFGYVKRTSNRAPGPTDIWWRQHLESCGGTFLKIKEPEKPKSSKVTKKENGPTSGSDLRKHFPTLKKDASGPPAFKGGIKTNGGGTLVLNPRTNKTATSNELPRTSTPNKAKSTFGNLTNVVGFKDLGAGTAPVSRNSASSTLSGVGYSLSSTEPTAVINLTGESSRKVDRNKLRDLWAKKFPSSSEKVSSQSDSAKPEEVIEVCSDPKKRRLSQTPDDEIIVLPKEENHWKIVDDDIMIKENTSSVIAISSDEDEENEPIQFNPIEIKSETFLTADERQRKIKQEIIESSDQDINEDDIELIDDDYDDNLVNTSAELADTSLIDDLFGEDTLLREFKKENAVIASSSRYNSDPKNDIIACPVCQDKIKREQFSEHIDGCVGIAIRVDPIKPKSSSSRPKFGSDKNKISSDKIAQTLKNAGYDPNELTDVIDTSYDSDEEDRSRRRDGLDTSTHACPVCAQEVDVDRINEHLDVCLK